MKKKAKAGAQMSDAASKELALLKRPSKDRAQRATEILAEEDHDPMRELVRVAKGNAPLTHPTVIKVLEFLKRLIETPGVDPAITAAASMLRPLVEKDLLGFTSQQEINRINIALLNYKHPELKAVEIDVGLKDSVASLFEQAVASANDRA